MIYTLDTYCLHIYNENNLNFTGDTSDERKQAMQVLTVSIFYVVAKANGFVLLDVDMLPLQGEHWQTDQMLSVYFSLLCSRFSMPLRLKFNLISLLLAT